MAQPPPDVEEDDCLLEYHHLFCPDLLRDKVAFITGGGSGIGFRIAEVFMRHGCHTVIASRSLPRVSMAARKLASATGQQCLPLSLDVRVPAAITAAVDQALKEFGKIDILVNCAAGNFLCPASVLSFNAFKTVMDIDALEHGCFMRGPRRGDCEHHCDPGYRGQVLQVHTGSAKAAMDAMTRHLAVEWGPQNIGVNSLAPGPISGTEGFQWLGAGRLKQRKHSEGEAGPQPVLDLWNASSGFLWDPPPLQPRALDLMIPAEFLKQRLEGPCCVHGPSLGPSPVLRQYSGREAGLLTACTRVSGVVSIPELP